ncbi:hypothetical protein QZH41_000196 [Actinostola sp. cb2023]|nr:hypothetical protein QZH41_000196 [Actinostola sp. cb2023]
MLPFVVSRTATERGKGHSIRLEYLMHIHSNFPYLTLTQKVVLEQWEKDVQAKGINDDGNQAFVLTRNQVALQKAQEKRDELIDRENKVAVKSLASTKLHNKDGPAYENAQRTDVNHKRKLARRETIGTQSSKLRPVGTQKDVENAKNVAENLKASQAKQKRLYDRKSSTRRFEEGDKVLVLLPTPGSKLETKWHGPYVITKVKDEGRSYEVDTGRSKKRHRTYYINLLKKWQDRDDDVAALVIPEPVAGILPHEGSLFRPNSVETWRDVQIYKNQKLLRWSVTLQEYDIKIEHKPGIKNTNVDALSRA